MPPNRATERADRIVLSYRSPAADPDRDRWPLADTDWIREELRRDSYVGYLRTVHGAAVERGEEWEEFVSGGCASSEAVVIRVEELVGGAILDGGTELEFVHRRAILAS